MLARKGGVGCWTGCCSIIGYDCSLAAGFETVGVGVSMVVGCSCWRWRRGWGESQKQKRERSLSMNDGIVVDCCGGVGGAVEMFGRACSDRLMDRSKVRLDMERRWSLVLERSRGVGDLPTSGVRSGRSGYRTLALRTRIDTLGVLKGLCVTTFIERQVRFDRCRSRAWTSSKSLI